MPRVIVAGKYHLLKKIGAGSFGKIYAARDITTGAADVPGHAPGLAPGHAPGLAPGPDKEYAIKITETAHMQNEAGFYERLREIKYIPVIYAAGTEGKYNYLVMDLLEQSLEELHKIYGGPMALKVVVHLALQMLTITEQIHAQGIIHRDLKPANFLIKTNAQNISELYLIDFGLANYFLDEKNRHREIKTNESMVGTTRYMSLNVHHGLTASRRDDLESLGYIMLFLHQGKLNWQNQESVKAVAEIKQNLGWSASAVGEFVLFILYCRNLGFADKPNYDYLRGLLTNLNKVL
jgi:serine/threonine protein kinase